MKHVGEIKKRLQVREQMRSLLLQFGVDEALEALQHVYKQHVYRQAKSTEPVQERMILLDQARNRLKQVRHEQTMLRLQ